MSILMFQRAGKGVYKAGSYQLLSKYQSFKNKFFSDQSKQFIFSLASIVAFHTHHLGNMSIANSTKKLLAQCDDFCLKLSKIKVLKMLDLQTKSAINSNNLQVQHQATNQAFSNILFDDPYISELDIRYYCLVM